MAVGLETARHLAALGLGPGATLADVQQAHRDLVNVWHPDRFAHVPRLRAKAEEKLKEINAAYAWLADHPETLGAGATPGPTVVPAPEPSGIRVGPGLWTAVVLALVAVLLLVVLDRRGHRHVRPAVAAVATEPALPTARPEGWPWRGLSVSSASGATPDDVARLKERLGSRFNYLRLTIDGRRMARQRHSKPAEAWRAALVWADLLLDECRTAGMTATVALAEAPLDPALGVTETSPAFWRDPALRAEVVELARALADHFAARGPELGGYEVLPRPYELGPHGPVLPPEWRPLLADVVDAIRGRDPLRWIVVAPGPGARATTYRRFAPLDDAHVVYAAQVFTPEDYTRQGIGRRPAGVGYPGRVRERAWDRPALARSVADLRRFAVAHRVPVVIDAFGVVNGAPGAAAYLGDLGAIFEQNGWGWAYYGVEEGREWNPDDDGDERGGATRWAAIRGLFAEPTP